MVMEKQSMLVDAEEVDILNRFREVKRHGHGRIEAVVLDGRLDTLYQALVFKRKKPLTKP